MSTRGRALSPSGQPPEASVVGSLAVQPKGALTQLVLIAVVTVLALSVWFATAAVVPSLTEAWAISEGQAAWLTMSVQLGFVLGAIFSALVNLADRISAPALIMGSTLIAGLCTLAVALLVDNLFVAVSLRVLTGAALAGVYPVSVMLLGTWFVKGRGRAMGIMIGATALGSASPHLIAGLWVLPWREVLIATSACALLSSLIAVALREGPLRGLRVALRPSYAIAMFRDKSQRSINFGYLGHMWELYAFWTWVPAFIAASVAVTRGSTWSGQTIAIVSFGVIGIAGLLGSVAAGMLAERYGSVRVATFALTVSGVCCLTSALIFGLPPWLLVIVLFVWGCTVIADSAQFSAALSYAAEPSYVGTALTIQMALGFLLTNVSIWLIPVASELIGWRWSFTLLAIGPLLGVLAMLPLVRQPGPPVG